MKTTGIILFISFAVVFIAKSSAKTYPYIKATCEKPEDCHYAYTCHKGECVHACGLRNSNELGNKCGKNAGCMTREPHSAICGCQPFHIGDPDIECKKVSAEDYLADLRRRKQH